MNLQIQIINTPDKFRPMAQELVPPLVELLRGLAAEEADLLFLFCGVKFHFSFSFTCKFQ